MQILGVRTTCIWAVFQTLPPCAKSLVPRLSEAGPSTKCDKRQVTKATFEKWQHEHERDLSWLRCELERDKRYVRGFSLLRAVCKKYKSNLKNFWRAWTSGSTNQKVSTVLDHATSEVHKAEMARLRAHRAKASGGSAVLTSTIGRSLSTLDHDTRSQMERKFDLCFVMAKHSIDIPVAKISSAGRAPCGRCRPRL